jgi:bacillithiol synthase
MTTEYLDYAATGAFAPLVLDYLARAPHLAPFYHRFPTLEGFEEQLREKAAAYPPEQRATLATEVRRQYLEQLGTRIHPAVVKNLDRLAEATTFTVTTGHQLSLMTGPLYFIYKIVSTIKLTQQLAAAYPKHHFVPVFWMATEDHDLPEIDHFSIGGQRFKWDTDQRGATGRMQPDAALAALLDTLPQPFSALEAAYRQSATLADATRRLVHELFGQFGLVALDADSPVLKAALRPVIRQELAEPVVQQAVHRANEELAAWYKPQIYARPINLFYLDGDVRERLERAEDGSFHVVNTNLSFTADELAAIAEAHPERFSPNVVLRPVYQELLLPNLAYIGGGAEVAYWLQLRGVFAALNVPFPMVLLRNSALYLPREAAIRLQKLRLTPSALFADLPALKRQVAAALGDAPLSFAAEQATLDALFGQLHALASSIDTTLEKTVAAESTRTRHRLDHLRQRLQKARDRRHSTAFQQVEALKERYFPGGGLQERAENVLALLPGNPALLTQLLAAFDPLGDQFTILTEAPE